MANKKKTSKKKYKHPVPSRSDLMAYLQAKGRPVGIDRIVRDLDLPGGKTKKKLGDQLARMVRSGQILQNRKKEFCLTERIEVLTGTVIGHRDGFGFVDRDDGKQDAYLSPREMREVLDGDRIAFKTIGKDRRGRSEARVVEVLERGVTEIAGQFIRERGVALVIPDNPRMSHRALIARGEAGKAKHGQMVVVEILDYPRGMEQMTGKVVRVLGDPDQKGIATDIAIHSHGIPHLWPKKVREAAKKLGSKVTASAKKGRIDLRDIPLVTIDGADARDFDDAVYCEPSGKGWRLIVAIADVGHYVAAEAPLDKEAIKRGTSVYFPDRVVPMLPEELSNGLCSLNPKVDRLCMVCEMRVSGDGKVTRSKFYEGLMRSHARLTYSEVHAFLTDNGKIPKGVRANVRALHDMFKKFLRARHRRGALELDIPQTRIAMDEDGNVTAMEAVERNDAHRLIEECMVAANVQAAKFIRRHRISGLFRVHARPDPDRFEELREYLLTLGLKVPHPEHVEPHQFAKLLREVQGRPDSQAISIAMLRSLMHAEYTPNNIGHFGLALDAYAHFTSPIRRYPDLLVHRAIRHILRGGKAGNYGYDQQRMSRLGAISSAHERRAEDATREVEATLKCQFMESRIGETFSGVVTSVTNFGLFVQLHHLQIDGLVHVSSLDSDYYHFDEASRTLTGERTGKTFALGDELDVVVSRVDLADRKIDFQLEGARRNKGGKRRRKGR